MNAKTKQAPSRSGKRIVCANNWPTHETSSVGPESVQNRPSHPGRLCAAEIDVLLRPCASFSPGLAMKWALEELLCRGHFVRVTDRGAAVPGRFVGYRVTVTPIPRSARPALASFAPLFDGHPRDIDPYDLADYVTEFGDELEVEHGYPCGSPLHWYERCVVDPLRAEGLVSVDVEHTWLGSVQYTRKFLEPTAHGEAVAAWYRDVLSSSRHRRHWRRPLRASEPEVPGAIDIAVTTLKRSQRTRTEGKLFVNTDFYYPE